jgi:hypothetical protein
LVSIIMAGRKARSAVFTHEAPAIHVFLCAMPQGVDARNKCGHDGGEDRNGGHWAAYFFCEVLLRGSSAFVPRIRELPMITGGHFACWNQ